MNDAWIQVNEHCYNYSDPTKSTVTFRDMVYSVARLPRFLGHTNRFYSVAEHCILCANIANLMGYEKEIIGLVLIHDLHESLIGDIPTPLKNIIGEKYSIVESQAKKYVRELAGIKYGEKSFFDDVATRKIDQIDDLAFMLEKEKFLPKIKRQRKNEHLHFEKSTRIDIVGQDPLTVVAAFFEIASKTGLNTI